MKLVVDTSVTVKWLFTEECTAEPVVVRGKPRHGLALEERIRVARGLRAHRLCEAGCQPARKSDPRSHPTTECEKPQTVGESMQSPRMHAGGQLGDVRVALDAPDGVEHRLGHAA